MTCDPRATLSNEERADLFDLLDMLLEEQLDRVGQERLDCLLSQSEEAQRLYVSEMHRHAHFAWECGILDEREEEPADEPFVVSPLSPPPPLSTTHYPLPTNFIGGPVFSYMVATVVLCLMLLGAWAYKINHDHNLTANNSRRSTTSGPLERPELVFVGRITGMKDCRWSDPDTQTVVGASASLGREYALVSGLLEITYTSGTRVILEGPCTYKVDSSAGGSLARGKLTARIIRQRPAASAAGAKPQAVFFVKTPTAIITDLGTEFGVEVSKDGSTESHVIEGKVKVRVLASAAGTDKHVAVSAGEAVRVEAGGKKFSVVPYSADRFIRLLNKPLNTDADEAQISAILADKPLGYWPLNEPANAQRFRDLSGNDFHGYRMRDVMSGRPGPLSGDSRAIELNGDGYIEVGRRDRFALANNFTFEAWIWIRNPSGVRARLFSAGDCNIPRQQSGWTIGYVNRLDRDLTNELPFCSFTCYGNSNSNVYHRVGMPLEEWFHLAFVFGKDNVKRLYKNGKLWKTFPAGEPAATGPTWVSIGWGSNRGGEYWRGRIAHVAVFDQPLSEQQIMNHYQTSQTQREDQPME